MSAPAFDLELSKILAYHKMTYDKFVAIFRSDPSSSNLVSANWVHIDDFETVIDYHPTKSGGITFVIKDETNSYYIYVIWTNIKKDVILRTLALKAFL